MNIYQFVVFHSGRTTSTFAAGYRHWESSYTYNNPEPVSHELLVEFAGRILFAERCLFDGQTEFIKIVCYEVQEGKPYDATTKTHTIMHWWNSSQYTPLTVGFRNDGCLDAFVVFRVLRNRNIGRCTVEEYPGAVAGWDLVHGLKHEPASHLTVLGTERGLVTQYFPVFRSVLESLSGEPQDYDVDRFGKKIELPELESGRMVGTVSNHVRQRSHWWRVSLQQQWFRDAINTASIHCQNALYYYSEAMAGFNHTWGDGHVPPLEHCMNLFLGAAALWKPLADALGFTYPANPTQQTLSPYTTPQPFLYFPAGTMTVKGSRKEILSCVATLYACHQWIINNYPAYYDLAKAFKARTGANPQRDEDYRAQAKIFYDDYDNLISVCFKITDCINVLQRIVIVSNKKKPYDQFHRVFQPGMNISDNPHQDPLIEVDVPPWVGYEPISKEPFITTPKRNVCTIQMPPEVPDKTRFTDRGPEHGHESETDEIMRKYNEDLQHALEPLKALKRLATKIRVEIIEPIRDFADAVDDAFNSVGL